MVKARIAVWIDPDDPDGAHYWAAYGWVPDVGWQNLDNGSYASKAIFVSSFESELDGAYPDNEGA